MSFSRLTGNGDARLSLRERVYHYLVEWLPSAERPADDSIDLDALCRALRISRTPLRDALLRLEQEGLVEIRPRQGVFVRPLTAAEVADICHILGLLEADALERRFPGPHRAFLRPLTIALRHQQTATQQGSEALFRHAERDFHRLLTGWSNVHPAARLAAPLLRRLDMQPRRPEQASARRAGVIEVHKRLLDSLARDNLTAAASILRLEYWLPALFTGQCPPVCPPGAAGRPSGPDFRRAAEKTGWGCDICTSADGLNLSA